MAGVHDEVIWSLTHSRTTQHIMLLGKKRLIGSVDYPTLSLGAKERINYATCRVYHCFPSHQIALLSAFPVC